MKSPPRLSWCLYLWTYSVRLRGINTRMMWTYSATRWDWMIGVLTKNIVFPLHCLYCISFYNIFEMYVHLYDIQLHSIKFEYSWIKCNCNVMFQLNWFIFDHNQLNRWIYIIFAFLYLSTHCFLGSPRGRFPTLRATVVA